MSKHSAKTFRKAYTQHKRKEQKLEIQAAYHGTTVENAKNILKEGLREYSHYTPYLNTALAQGGPVVFIWYILDPEYQRAIKEGQWQFITAKTMPPDEFIAVVYYKDVKLIKYNGPQYYKLRKIERPSICPYCRGYGDLNYPDDGHSYLPGGSSFKTVDWKINMCPKCKGHGDFKRMKEMEQ